MKNPIKTWLQRRRQKKASKENLKWLQSVAQQHQWLDQLRTAGLLQWDVVQRRLFIEADLAILFMGSAERWTAFIHNTYQWLYYNLAQQTMEDYFHQEELKAVRDAMAAAESGTVPAAGDGSLREQQGGLHENRPHNALSRADIDRIRRHRRAEIMQQDVPVPQVEPFEFFIVRSDAPDTTAAQQATGRLIAVGHYDPANDDIDIASWDDVMPLLKTAQT
jgi:hypothetical protein